MASLIPDDAVSMAKEMFRQPANWGVENYGCFWNVNQEMWDAGCERMVEVKSVMLEHSAIMVAALEDAGWIVPLFTQMAPLHLSHMPIVDVGCGSSSFLWDGYLRGLNRLLGIDMRCHPSKFPPGVEKVESQILDLPAVRASLDPVSFPAGGLMVCTEMLEHMEFNPLPGMLLIIETLKPKHLYVTVPTYLNRDNKRSSWVHYSELPTYRGQRMPMSPWHYKGWAMDELSEFCSELGFDQEGMFGGYSRIGFLGTSVRKS